MDTKLLQAYALLDFPERLIYAYENFIISGTYNKEDLEIIDKFIDNAKEYNKRQLECERGHKNNLWSYKQILEKYGIKE